MNKNKTKNAIQEAIDFGIDVTLLYEGLKLSPTERMETHRQMLEFLEEARKNLSEEFGNLISPLVLTEKEFKTSKNRPFAQDLKYNYEIIAGEDFIKRWWIDDKNKKC